MRVYISAAAGSQESRVAEGRPETELYSPLAAAPSIKWIGNVPLPGIENP